MNTKNAKTVLMSVFMLVASVASLNANALNFGCVLTDAKQNVLGEILDSDLINKPSATVSNYKKTVGDFIIAVTIDTNPPTPQNGSMYYISLEDTKRQIKVTTVGRSGLDFPSLGYQADQTYNFSCMSQ